MARKRGIENIVPDIKKNLTNNFNTFIQTALKQLATKQNSPVYTGFFASSWIAGTQRSNQVDEVQNFQPWAGLKKRRDKGDTTAHKIEPRYVPPVFKSTDKVFIGNTTKYAAYASENPIITRYVQGEFRYLIRSIFREMPGTALSVQYRDVEFDERI